MNQHPVIPHDPRLMYDQLKRFNAADISRVIPEDRRQLATHIYGILDEWAKYGMLAEYHTYVPIVGRITFKNWSDFGV